MRILFYIAIEKKKMQERTIIRDNRYRKILRTMLKRIARNASRYSRRERWCAICVTIPARSRVSSVARMTTTSRHACKQQRRKIRRRLFFTYDDLVIIRAVTIERVDTVCCAPSYPSYYLSWIQVWSNAINSYDVSARLFKVSSMFEWFL